MEMKQSLSQRLTTQLIMTPRLQQALKLLQVPTLELQQILKQEIMQNPLLEEVDEIADSEDQAKEDSPEEKANEEAEDPAEEDPIDWSEYMQEGALDRTYIPETEQSVEFLEKVPVTRTTANCGPISMSRAPRSVAMVRARCSPHLTVPMASTGSRTDSPPIRA